MTEALTDPFELAYPNGVYRQRTDNGKAVPSPGYRMPALEVGLLTVAGHTRVVNAIDEIPPRTRDQL